MSGDNNVNKEQISKDNKEMIQLFLHFSMLLCCRCSEIINVGTGAIENIFESDCIIGKIKDHK